MIDNIKSNIRQGCHGDIKYFSIEYVADEETSVIILLLCQYSMNCCTLSQAIHPNVYKYIDVALIKYFNLRETISDEEDAGWLCNKIA